MLGAFHLAGEVVLVLPMAALLGLSGPAEGAALYHHLLLLPPEPGRPRLALLVDRATDSLHAEATLLQPGASFNDCVAGDLRIDGVLVPMVTAAERLVTGYEAVRLAAFAARQSVRDAAFAPAGPG